MSTTPSQNDAKAIAPRGKQRKRFLEKNDALTLAASIAEIQEKISTTKAEKHHKPQDYSRSKQDLKHSSCSKAKLKETKAALKAKQINTKKERVKSRKERLKPKPAAATNTGQSTPAGPDRQIRKMVSFA